MSRKTTKSILSRDEISLLRNSEEIKNVDLYGNLYNTLFKITNLEAVSLNELNEYGLDDKGSTILAHTKGKLIDDITHEWYVESKSAEDPDKKVRCGLCNTPNRYLFYIKNRLSNVQLNVGSSCMKKFSEIDGYANHKYELGQIQKNQRERARWLQFHDKFPEAESIIDSANFYFDNLPILLPYKIYFHLEDVVQLLHIIHIQYIKYGKTPNETQKDPFKLFEETINRYSKLKVKADDFIKQNINKPYICKHTEIDWMRQNKKDILLKKISLNNGFYTVDSLGEIASVNFINQNFNTLSSRLPSKFIRLICPKDEHSSLYFTIKQGYEYLYSISIKRFMKQIGSKCFFDNTYIIDEQELFKISKIVISNKALEHITESLKDDLDKMRYALLVDDYAENVFLYHKFRKDIKEFTYADFLHLYDLNKIRKHKSNKDFIGFLLTYRKWMSFDEQERTGIDEKVSKLYYHQYIEPYK